jgi:peroxiredoxin
VVGLGTQDDLGQAEDFVATHSLTFPVLWDSGFDSWRALGVAGQPSVVLIDGQGRELGRWSGGIPEADVLALV